MTILRTTIFQHCLPHSILYMVCGFRPFFAFLLIVFFCFSSALPARAAQPYRPSLTDPVQEPWRWDAFPELSGLGLECIYQTSDGAMWFGVEDGVRRYDGIRWKGFNAADGLDRHPVRALLQTTKGDFYAGANTGLYRFQRGRWQRVLPTRMDGGEWSPFTPERSRILLDLAPGSHRSAGARPEFQHRSHAGIQTLYRYPTHLETDLVYRRACRSARGGRGSDRSGSDP